MKQPNLFDASPIEPSAPPPRDQAEREFAVDPRHHVVLEASAGTGKTRVLVDRYVRLIDAGVDPRNILAITFTRKAAAEMRERVIARLEERAGSDAGFAKRWRVIGERLADVTIATIDAFCFGLLREFPLEADVDPAFDIADETAVPRFVNEAIELALRDCRPLIVTDENVRLLFARVRPRELRRALARLLDARHVSAPAIARFVREHVRWPSVDAACERFLRSLREVFDGRRRSALLDDGPRGSAEFEWLRRDVESLATLGPGEHAAVRRLRRRAGEYFGTGKGPRKSVARRFESAFAGTAEKRRHVEALKDVAPVVVAAADAFDADVNGLLARGLERVLAIAIRRYESLLAEHSVLDFPAMLAKAVDLLSRQEEFARSRLKLQSRYQHLLIDEFQDTSRLQWRLVQCLTDAWREGEGVAGTEPSIFIVGDRKQSIYRFRHAEAALLDEAAAFIESLREGPTVRRAIQHSFRAVPELLAFVNALAAGMTSAAELDDAFTYRETDRFPAPSVGPGARRDGTPVLGLAVEASLDACAAAVASEIDQLLRDRVPVRDRLGARQIQPDDIAILFRSRAGHRAFEEALDARGVETYVYKGLGFFDAPEVQDVRALIRYLAAPDSDLRAAEFLRSRFVRISDVALTALAPRLADALRSARVDVGAAGLADDDAALLRRARLSVAAWLPLVDRVPPGDLLDRILADAAYAYEMRGRRRSQARENVKKVRALVRRVQNHGYATMARLADYFETLSAGDESNAVVAAHGAVQLMTIHAAKGLEFPVVFLVRMNASAGGRGEAISVVTKDERGEPHVTIGGRSDAMRIERQRDAEEARRLLYVAATRARDRLYFAAEVAEGNVERRGGTPFLSLLPESLRRVVIGAGTSHAAEVEWRAAADETFAFHRCRPTAGSGPAPAPVVVAAGPLADVAPLVAADLPRAPVTGLVAGTGDVPVQTDPNAPSDLAVGAIVHRLLQQVHGPGDDAVLAALASAFSRTIDDVGHRETAVSRALEIFRAIWARPDVSAWLSSEACLFEVPFSARFAGLPGQIVRGTIDALVLPASGPIVVIEFKTGQPRPEHERQLAAYVDAVRQAWPGRVVESRLIYA